MTIGAPNMNEGLRRANGRLLPIGWLRILRARRRAERLDLLLGGIKDGYRSKGVDVLLGRAMGAVGATGRLHLHRQPSRARVQHEDTRRDGAHGRGGLQAIPRLPEAPLARPLSGSTSVRSW